MGDLTLIEGDCLQKLQTLPHESVQVCVTSPPYWNLRDYGHDNQIGLEKTAEEYIEKLLAVFQEVKRVLRDDGTLWLNLGDCFVNKNLAGIPWRVALSLQSDGWILRSDIIWEKPSAMPDPVKDRPARVHEYIFLMSKSKKYFYDHIALMEAAKRPGRKHKPSLRQSVQKKQKSKAPVKYNHTFNHVEKEKVNKRSVWKISLRNHSEAHFAAFPDKLAMQCILGGSPKYSTVLDPFAGTGTVLIVANRLQRKSIGIEINPEYCEIIKRRSFDDAPLLQGIL